MTVQSNVSWTDFQVVGLLGEPKLDQDSAGVPGHIEKYRQNFSSGPLIRRFRWQIS